MGDFDFELFQGIMKRIRVEGILPAYHMNKGKWISILLDGSVDAELVKSLLDMSYRLTK